MPMANMRNWHLDINPKFYDICFYFEFFPIPDSKHWQEKLHQQIFGAAMTDPTLQWKKKFPQKLCATFSLWDQQKSSFIKTWHARLSILLNWIHKTPKMLVCRVRMQSTDLKFRGTMRSLNFTICVTTHGISGGISCNHYNDLYDL